MAVPTSTEFTQRFPEFGELALPVIEGALTEAGRSTPADNWGTIHTEAVTWRPTSSPPVSCRLASRSAASPVNPWAPA